MKTGDLIDNKYEIVERLGIGGMGEVYRARHTYLGTPRVIKIIRPQISGRQDVLERFLREARLATRVQHPHVATLHDFSALADGSHYMVWEYIDGENLAQRIRARGPLPPGSAIRIAIESLEGLEAIHRAGIVHRDISPENLMLTRDGDRVKIIDLGVAKSDDPEEGTTQAGMFIGKLKYASPEQMGFLPEGERIDARADLYSIAVVLYEMLTGRPPFEAKAPHEYFSLHSPERAERIVDMTPVPGSDPLKAVLRKALERDRKRRFADAAEFRMALERVWQAITQPIGEPQPSSERPTMAMPIEEIVSRGIEPTTPIPVPTPTPQPVAAPARPRDNRALAVIVILALLAAAAIVFALRYKLRQTPSRAAELQKTVAISQAPPPPTQTAAATASTSATSSVPQTSIDVTSTRLVENPAVRLKKAKTETAKVVDQKPGGFASTMTNLLYVDGDDRGENVAALTEARDQLAGVKSVAVRGEPSPLLEQLKTLLARELTVSDDADVVIRFSGSNERVGRLGKKHRAGNATITKNGRIVFRYELPSRDYRIGDDPAEAFARVMRSVMRQ